MFKKILLFSLLCFALPAFASSGPNIDETSSGTGPNIEYTGPRWFYKQAADPACQDDRAVVYSKEVAGVDELFVARNIGGVCSPIQVSSGGITPVSPWDRDNTNGYVYPHVITDKIGIGTIVPSEYLELGKEGDATGGIPSFDSRKMKFNSSAWSGAVASDVSATIYMDPFSAVVPEGYLTFKFDSGIVNQGNIKAIASGAGAEIVSDPANGSGAIAFTFASDTDLTTAGAKLFSLGDNWSAYGTYAELFYIDYLGGVHMLTNSDIDGTFTVLPTGTASVGNPTYPSNILEVKDSVWDPTDTAKYDQSVKFTAASVSKYLPEPQLLMTFDKDYGTDLSLMFEHQGVGAFMSSEPANTSATEALIFLSRTDLTQAGANVAVFGDNYVPATGTYDLKAKISKDGDMSILGDYNIYDTWAKERFTIDYNTAYGLPFVVMQGGSGLTDSSNDATFVMLAGGAGGDRTTDGTGYHGGWSILAGGTGGDGFDSGANPQDGGQGGHVNLVGGTGGSGVNGGSDGDYGNVYISYLQGAGAAGQTIIRGNTHVGTYGLTVYDGIYSNDPSKFNDYVEFATGAAATPSIRFTDDADTGLFRDSKGRIKGVEFTGTGDPDVNFSSTFSYTGATNNSYVIEIMAGDPTDPNTFQWSNDGGTTWNDNGGAGYAITGSSQLIEEAIYLDFLATTGRDDGDKWEFTATPEPHMAVAVGGAREATFLNDELVIKTLTPPSGSLLIQGISAGPIATFRNMHDYLGSMTELLNVYAGTTDKVALMNLAGGWLTGATADQTSFPYALNISSHSDSGYTDAFNISIGHVGEAESDGTNYASGLMGVGSTKGAGSSVGITGYGVVDNTSDTGVATGGYFGAFSTHAGGNNVAITATAHGGAENYSFDGTGDLENEGRIIFTPGTDTLDTNDYIEVRKGVVKVVGNGGAVTNIGLEKPYSPGATNDAKDGQIVIIKGNSDTNTVSIADGRNTMMAGGVDFTLGAGDTITFMFCSLEDSWVEISRSNN